MAARMCASCVLSAEPAVCQPYSARGASVNYSSGLPIYRAKCVAPTVNHPPYFLQHHPPSLPDAQARRQALELLTALGRFAHHADAILGFARHEQERMK